MARRVLFLVPALVLALAFTACVELDSAWGGRSRVRGSGDVERESRHVSGIHAVELATIGTLIIEIGNDEGLVIEAEDNLLEHIETDVSRGKLTIDNERDVSLNPRKRIRYYLTVKELDEITVSSSGDIVAPDLEAKRFELSIESSGDFEMGTLDCTALEVSISSSGDAFIEELSARTVDVSISSSGSLEIGDGTVEEQEVHISSSGDYRARRLDSETAVVRISSSGSAHVRVRDRLDATTSSSGDVNYYGDPRVRSRETSSGDVHRAGR
ncbi:MAG TPA: head GIN domain-containing protein [Acidobacteriota bacterium]|nr:head GIN domain-containing protein [Acidobacteriota bacterium]